MSALHRNRKLKRPTHQTNFPVALEASRCVYFMQLKLANQLGGSKLDLFIIPYTNWHNLLPRCDPRYVTSPLELPFLFKISVIIHRF